MDLSGLVENAKQSVLGSLEQRIYEQASADRLADTVLAALVENAVGKLQVEMPVAATAVRSVLGVLSPFLQQADALGVDDKILELLKGAGLDAALQERVISGLTRYLQDNGARLMNVAMQALVRKLSQPT